MSLKTEKRDFYTKLACYYDKIYRQVDYEEQALFFNKLFSKYCHSHGRRVLDLCCGTGTHIGYLSKKNFTIVGWDISKEMLDQARIKFPKLDFVQKDMRDLAFVNEFDLILCFFNSILYNRPVSVLKRTLQNIWKALKPGGIIILDIIDKKAGVNSKPDKYTYLK